MYSGACGVKYIELSLSLSTEIIVNFRQTGSSLEILFRVLGFLRVSWDKLGFSFDDPIYHEIACICEEDSFGIFNEKKNLFFTKNGERISCLGQELKKEFSENKTRDINRFFINEESEWYKGRWCSREILIFGSELLKTFEMGRYSSEVILNTLSFLFENWKDMGEEEWNDPYVLLEELVNSSDFPKTEEDQKTNIEFCEKYQNEIRAFGVVLQEDLKKRGFFEPQESETAKFFRENPEADPFREK